MERNNLLIPSSIIAFGLIVCAVILALVWRGNQRANQTINVTGSAKKEIVSDLGILRGTITAESSAAETAFKNLRIQKPLLVSYLKKKGFPEELITFYPVNSYPVYEIGATGYQTSNVRGYVYSQRMEIQSGDVEKIKEISLDITSLIEMGVRFNVEMPEYHFTKLADLKIEVQAEAAKDAMIRASKIAEATGRSIGIMRNARMGVLQITPKFSTMVSDYGINDVSSIVKEITAVVNASFEIE